MSRPVIKFKATATTCVGDIIRHPSRGVKFWVVYKIEDGVAFARPDAAPAPRGCC